jgi:hypothetical protein
MTFSFIKCRTHEIMQDNSSCNGRLLSLSSHDGRYSIIFHDTRHGYNKAAAPATKPTIIPKGPAVAMVPAAVKDVLDGADEVPDDEAAPDVVVPFDPAGALETAVLRVAADVIVWFGASVCSEDWASVVADVSVAVAGEVAVAAAAFVVELATALLPKPGRKEGV